jgi:hypothetical protein
MVSAVALATGQVSGRSIADILAAAVAAGDREDRVTEARCTVRVTVSRPS